MEILIDLIIEKGKQNIEFTSTGNLISKIENLLKLPKFTLKIHRNIENNISEYQTLIVEFSNNKSKISLNYSTSKLNNYESIEINRKDLNTHLRRFLNKQTPFATKRLFEKHTYKSSQNKNSYEKWKVKYQNERKKEIKKNVLKLMIGLITLVIISFSVKIIYTGEYKFIGKKTLTTNATVYKTSWYHWGKAYYYQVAYMKYNYKSKTYDCKTKIGRLTKMQFRKTVEIGNSVLIEIREDKPEIFRLKK